MSGIIILDGPDCCGKTTLGKHLEEKYGALYIHSEGRFFDRMFSYHTALLLKAVAASDKRVVVMDRFWPSELIYADVFRGGTKFPSYHRMLDRVIRKHCGVYVMCLPNNRHETIERYYANVDPTHPYDVTQYGKILDRYNDFYDKYGSRPDFMRYRVEVEGKDMDDFCFQAAQKINDLKVHQYPKCLNPNFHNLIGHMGMASVLVVGDVLNPKGKIRYRWPFYEYGNSSLFLANILDKAEIKDHRLMFINANDEGSMDVIRELRNLGKFRRKVTLGENARKALEKHGISSTTIRHPSYVKRFAVPEEEYIEQIKTSFTLPYE